MQLRLRHLALAALPFLIGAMALPSGAQTPRNVAPSSAPVAALPDSARALTDHGSPVLLERDTLFVLHASLGPFTAAVRATAVAERLRALTVQAATPHDSIIAVDQPNFTELLSGDLVVMTVLDGDAEASGRPRLVLAREWAGRINARLETLRIATSPRALAYSIGFTIIATLVLVLLLALISRLFPQFYSLVDRVRDVHQRLAGVQIVRLVSPTHVATTLLGLLRFVRVILTVVLLYFYVPLVRRFFPWTEQLSRQIVGYALTPFAAAGAALIAYLPNVFYIVAIVVITRFALKFVRVFFDAIGAGSVTFESFHPDWAEPTYKIARVLVFAFAAVVIFPYLPGSQSDAFKGVSLFLGVLFSLGSSSAVSNVVAGVVLTYTRSFHIGDRVRVGDTTGDVMERTLLVTRIRTIKNVDVTIPNGIVLNGQVVNYSALASTSGLILHTTVTIGYDAPWRQVHALLIDAARRTTLLEQEPPPFVLQTSLDDFYVSYEINATTLQPSKMASIYAELHQNIQETFNEARMEIMSPHYGALRDGNATAMPADVLGAAYRAPPFRVAVDGGAGRAAPTSSRVVERKRSSDATRVDPVVPTMHRDESRRHDGAPVLEVRYVSEDGLRGERAPRLLRYLAAHGADEFSITVMALQDTQAPFVDRFEDELAPFERPPAARHVRSAGDGTDVTRTVRLWTFNEASLARLLSFSDTGIFHWPAGPDGWFENLLIYRRGELVLGLDSHEREGVLCLTQHEHAEVAAMNIPSKPTAEAFDD
jgi:small-conductance mechanosensitive channel